MGVRSGYVVACEFGHVHHLTTRQRRTVKPAKHPPNVSGTYRALAGQVLAVDCSNHRAVSI
jgi:hypothetical protein